MKPDFSTIPYDAASVPGAIAAADATASLTPEGIAVKPVYTAADVAPLDHLGVLVGDLAGLVLDGRLPGRVPLLGRRLERVHALGP